MNDVAVLLPVRLETLFESDGTTTTMLLRIVPDEASIRRDDPVPTPSEIALLTAMWTAAHTALTPQERGGQASDWLGSDAARPAWELFCGQVAPPRASWLAGRYPPAVVDGVVTVDAPDAVDHAPLPNRVGGFPARIEIWCAFGADAPILLATTDPDPSVLVFDVIGGRVADDGTVTEQADRWWVSWELARAAGLGVEIALPNGLGPADISVLYAVGLGEENPEEHFRAQIDAGELAAAALGAPTNAVDGAQAAALGHAPEDWRAVAARRLLRARIGGVDDPRLSAALAGGAAALPPIPHPPGPDELDRMLVTALWPALWGHVLRDVWGFGEDAERLGSWACENLAPEGPLPPLRIGGQPYGLLPTSAMSRWRITAAEGAGAACAERILPALLTLRARSAAAAREHGTAVGADTPELLDLISRDAVSAGYAYRLFLPDELWSALYGMTTGVDADDFDDQVRRTLAPAVEFFGTDPVRRYLAAGGSEELAIPLVTPTVWPHWFWEPDGQGGVQLDEHGRPVPAMTVEAGLAALLEPLSASDFPLDAARELWRGVLPDSLLVRLLLLAGLHSSAAVVRTDAGDPTPLLEPVIGDTTVPTLLRSLGQLYSGAAPHDHPSGTVRRFHGDGLERIHKALLETTADTDLPARLERALRATLDTATHRVDPWLIGIAAQRLRHLGARPDTRFRLGVYGWVDGPILGSPGPTAGGLLHAPSHAQAVTAVVLRDKSVSERREVAPAPGERDLWSVQLESARIRLAEELAEEVRIGSHLFEVLGRQIERIIGSRDGVGALRSAFPLHPGQDAAGRVCHGAAALDALLDRDPPPVPVSGAQRGRLELLRGAVDTYGDLLVAEAVHQVVTGRADIAGAAMDAAAGLGAPPTLAFTETPLGGEGMTSTVVSAIPFRPSVPGTDSPAVIADASVAAALQELTGTADTWVWTGPAATVTLLDLGLEPVETVVLSTDLLDALVRFRLGADPTAEVTGTGRERHRQAREIVTVLGSQPAFVRDVAPTSPSTDTAGIAALDAAILDELRSRYTELRAAAQAMLDELAAAVEAADQAALAVALWRAVRWGVAPIVAHEEQQALFAAMLDGVPPPNPGLLIELAGRAREALQARVDAAPAVDAREPIGRSISELAAPEGRLAVLSMVGAPTLAAIAHLVTDVDATLDGEWLPVIAAVRPQLARLEAFQLEALLTDDAATGFTVWSSAPDDHWQTSALAALVTRRTQPGADPRAHLPRFVAVFGVGVSWAAADPEPMIAIGLVDSWSETAPRPRQTTTAAFGFNAPAARPPQAILLAVPPDPDATDGVPMQASDLVGVLTETRELAHARAVQAEELGDLLTALPTSMLQATGPTGMRPDTGTVF